MQYKPRKMMFKAWNRESKLLMRLNSIECKRGELVKNNHILLQFTGLYDKQKEEIYEMDILMIGSDKFIVKWDEGRNGWALSRVNNEKEQEPFLADNAQGATRLWNYFETEK